MTRNSTHDGATRAGRLIDLPDAQRVLRTLAAAINNFHVYPPDHDLVTSSRRSLHRAVTTILARYDETSIERVEDEFSFEGLPILGVRDQARALSSRFADLDIEVIRFSRGLRESEIGALVEVLDTQSAPDLSVDAAGMLQAKGASHIHLGRLAVMGAHAADEDGQTLETVYSSAVEVARDLMGHARRGKTLDLALTQSMVVKLVERMLCQKDSTLALAMMKTYDEYLFVHSVNVTILTLGIAETFTSDEEILLALGKAAMVHDIGKTAVPPEILHKSTHLNDAEWDIMRSHPEMGVRMIESAYNKFNLATLVAFEHHLHFDGGGYPAPRFRQAKTPYSMMASIADCYDALTTERPYRKAMTPEAALNLMAEGSGAQFEPRLLRSFLLTMGIYPVGSLVRLTTGETCIIRERSSSDATRPRVTILLDPAGETVSEVATLDLAERNPFTGEHVRSIKEAVAYTAVPDLDLSRYLGSSV